MVAGTWLVLEDLSLVQFELYLGGGEIHPPLNPQGALLSVRGSVPSEIKEHVF